MKNINDFTYNVVIDIIQDIMKEKNTCDLELDYKYKNPEFTEKNKEVMIEIIQSSYNILCENACEINCQLKKYNLVECFKKDIFNYVEYESENVVEKIKNKYGSVIDDDIMKELMKDYNKEETSLNIITIKDIIGMAASNVYNKNKWELLTIQEFMNDINDSIYGLLYHNYIDVPVFVSNLIFDEFINTYNFKNFYFDDFIHNQALCLTDICLSYFKKYTNFNDMSYIEMIKDDLDHLFQNQYVIKEEES